MHSHFEVILVLMLLNRGYESGKWNFLFSKTEKIGFHLSSLVFLYEGPAAVRGINPMKDGGKY
jgi:hypothetical protein